MTKNELEKVNYELVCGDKAYPRYTVQTAWKYGTKFVDRCGDTIEDDCEILCENSSGRFYTITRDDDDKIDFAEEVEQTV